MAEAQKRASRVAVLSTVVPLAIFAAVAGTVAFEQHEKPSASDKAKRGSHGKTTGATTPTATAKRSDPVVIPSCTCSFGDGQSTPRIWCRCKRLRRGPRCGGSTSTRRRASSRRVARCGFLRGGRLTAPLADAGVGAAHAWASRATRVCSCSTSPTRSRRAGRRSTSRGSGTRRFLLLRSTQPTPGRSAHRDRLRGQLRAADGEERRGGPHAGERQAHCLSRSRTARSGERHRTVITGPRTRSWPSLASAVSTCMRSAR